MDAIVTTGLQAKRGVTRRLTFPAWARRVPARAIEICDDDAQGRRGDIKCERMVSWGKNIIIQLKAGREEYAIKMPRVATGWLPSNEFAGYQEVQRRISGNSKFGVIKAVGYSDYPKFLVTRYCSGRSLLEVFDHAIGGRGCAEDAISCSQLIGEWLHQFRGKPVSAEGPALGIREAAPVLARRLLVVLDEGDSVSMDQLREWAVQLRDEALGSGMRRPSTGDLAPQNFCRDSRGLIAALDFEGFGWTAIEHDVIGFRSRLEQCAAYEGAAMEVARQCWDVFLRAYLGEVTAGDKASICMACYFPRLISTVKEAVTQRSPVWRVMRRRGQQAWLKNRCAWLKKVAERGRDPVERFALEL